MARSYKFSLIQARPDSLRGERVNVGIAIDRDAAQVDIRMPELRKLRPLTGHAWDEVGKAYSEHLQAAGGSLFDLKRDAVEIVSEVFVLGSTGTFVASTPDEYESRIQSILAHLVNKPRLSRRERQEKINSEIAKVLKNAGVFGRQGDSIDGGRVVPKFVVSEEKSVIADFAYKTAKLKIVSTLDLRSARAAHGKACEKGATLYFAKEKFGDSVRPFGVYAATAEDAEMHRSEIEVLRSFAEGNVFNWTSAQDRQKFTTSFY
jgi:hypothetical protein